MSCPGNRVQTVSGQRTRADSADWGKSRKDRDLSTGLRAMALTGDRGQFQGGAGGERGRERRAREDADSGHEQLLEGFGCKAEQRHVGSC